MRIGDVILSTAITARNTPVKPTAQVSYKSPKGTSFVFLLLGTTNGEFSPEDALRGLGWIPDPSINDDAARKEG